MAQLRPKSKSPGIILIRLLVRFQIILCCSSLKTVWWVLAPPGQALHGIMLPTHLWAAPELGLSFLFLKHKADRICTPREWDSSPGSEHVTADLLHLLNVSIESDIQPTSPLAMTESWLFSLCATGFPDDWQVVVRTNSSLTISPKSSSLLYHFPNYCLGSDCSGDHDGKVTHRL